MSFKSKVKRILRKAGILPAGSKKKNKKTAGKPNQLGREQALTQEGVGDPSAVLAEGQLTEQEIWEAEAAELAEVERLYQNVDREHVWAFVAGHTSQDFRGNPKFLFVYVNRYRPDIKAYWLCSDEETIEQVRALGFAAYKLETPAAQYIINRTGVLIAEQVKTSIPEGFTNIKYINLWHGIGFKRIERKQFMGDIAMGLAKKYVSKNEFYRDNQLLNVTCPVIEDEFSIDCGVDPDKLLRTGYPRCLYQQNFEPIASFDHDLRAMKGLPAHTRLVVYAPTFRASLDGTFAKAIADIDRLYDFCQKHDILFIFKVHPNMEREAAFLKAAERYKDSRYFWFWDNRDDFYEVMHQMDLAIVDYSSIISDMVAMGIKHYIRYVFDLDEYISTAGVQDNFFEKTTGKLCYSFDELLDAMGDFEQRDESAEIQRLNQLLWSYSQGKDDFERIIQAVFDFKVEKRKFPTLYSFDIFDTLFSRKVLDPMGVFYAVQEKIAEHGGFPYIFTKSYPLIRHTAEFNVREFYSKTRTLRDSEWVEITFDEIFDRIASVYDLDEAQTALLKQWELETELDNVVPLPAQINLVKQLIADGQQVVLISDMYLTKEFVQKLLYKADPVLAQLPLFLSSEYGVLKTSQKLYFEVYKSFEPYYDFEKWIHYGDNDRADKVQARRFEIRTRQVKKPEYNDIQRELVEHLNTYDSYLVAAMQARMCEEYCYGKDEFVISFISLCFVPYIDWVLRDAERRGYQTLYFISRDGHHLKRIADAIIQERGLKFKTKYIYASRRTWRIPSFFHEVDSDFWLGHGSFGDIISKEKLFSAMELDEEMFREFFPFIDPDGIDFLNTAEFNSLKEIFKNSKQYNDYLLEKAARDRELVSGYLRQEIDPNEKFAFVEYYGRGYTQDCFVNLWRDIVGNETERVAFYYSRTVLPTLKGSIRYNFTTNDEKPYFIESIFANMPYKSIQKYQREDGVITVSYTHLTLPTKRIV